LSFIKSKKRKQNTKKIKKGEKKKEKKGRGSDETCLCFVKAGVKRRALWAYSLALTCSVLVEQPSLSASGRKG